MLSLDDLRFFGVVAAGKSLAQAARSLDVTPPAVSQRLAALERRMGVRLVERQRGGVILTNEGEIVAARARMILEELDELHSQIAARRDELFGPLRINAPLGFGRRFIAPLVATFHAKHPGVTIDLVLNDRPPESITRFDINIHIGELRDSAGIMAKLASNERITCASPRYLAAHGAPATPMDLGAHDCIALRENDEDATLWRFSHQDQPLSVRIRPRLASNDGDVIRQWAIDGLGIIVRSEWHVADDLRSGQLVQVLSDYPAPPADVVALLGPSHARVARTQRFLDHLKSGLSPAPWRRAGSGPAAEDL